MDQRSDKRARLEWERRCIKRVRKGDRVAFAELYEAFAGELYARVLLPKLGDAAAAEDALAETFRTAFERIEQFDDQGVSVWFWLARIGTNKAMDMHRVRARTQRALTSYEGLLAPLREEPAAPGAVAESAAERRRVSGAVRQVLEQVNPRYRQAIELRFFEERGREECAERMDVKLGTFDVLMLRALRAFRREWEAAWPGREEEL